MIKALIVFVLVNAAAVAQTPLGTSFTYQGELKEIGLSAIGDFDFEFNLLDDEDPFFGNLIATQSFRDVRVEDGLFSVELDFGDVFTGDALWLEIRVRSSGNGALTALFPLQKLTAAPYAFYARRAEEADRAMSADNADLLDGLDSQDFVSLEVDPTVPASVKDGIAWSELNGVPAGFADNVDDTGSGVPVGTVVAFAGTQPPAGWLLCDGSEISRTTYADLFAVLGGTWGPGDGQTTFALPDLQGRVALGSGAGTDLSSRAIGELGGEESHLLTVDEMPSHRHTIGFTRGDQNGGIGARFIGGSGGANTSAEGGDQPHNNLPPFTVVHYIIKY